MVEVMRELQEESMWLVEEGTAVGGMDVGGEILLF